MGIGGIYVLLKHILFELVITYVGLFVHVYAMSERGASVRERERGARGRERVSEREREGTRCECERERVREGASARERDGEGDLNSDLFP
jgi:hypothetical protein